LSHQEPEFHRARQTKSKKNSKVNRERSQTASTTTEYLTKRKVKARIERLQSHPHTKRLPRNPRQGSRFHQVKEAVQRTSETQPKSSYDCKGQKRSRQHDAFETQQRYESIVTIKAMDHETMDIICPPFSLEIKTSRPCRRAPVSQESSMLPWSSGPFNLDRWMTGAAGILISCAVTIEEKL
jgi:hypothetical protein